MAKSLHIIIVGGGLGGLCLAQGLKKAGISVAVYERDRTPHDRLQGYRIHIDPNGNRALYACLPRPLFDTYVAASGVRGDGLRIVTEQLDPIAFFGVKDKSTPTNPADFDLSISRITLREILLTGLEDVVHFNKSFTHYEERPDGTVTAFFEDGTQASGDVLVGAEGVNSRVRKQLLPNSQIIDTGVGAIMGKRLLDDEARALLIPGSMDGATTILGPHGHGMFMALHELKSAETQPVSQGASDLLLDNTSDYIFWAFVARQEKFPFNGSSQLLDGDTLRTAAMTMTQDWHPNLRQSICEADPATLIYKSLRTSTPVSPWTTTHVTLVGDAIHSMPPTRGIGGSTAFRDASLLCQTLIVAQTGQQPLIKALHSYEGEMLKYGFAAVRSSLQAMNMIVAEQRLFYRVMLKIAGLFAA